MGAHVLPRTRRHARSSRLDAARAVHLRDDAKATGSACDIGEDALATSKSPSRSHRASSVHSRFTLRDLMHAPNAPLAQLRSPLRRADSMANRGKAVSETRPSPRDDANPFPLRKHRPAPLKALLRASDDPADRENADPRGARNTTRATPNPPAENDAREGRGAREPEAPDSPAFVAAVRAHGGDRSSGKRKAATELDCALASSGESFSFFRDETRRAGPASREDVSKRERELLEAIQNEKAAAAAARASMSLGRWRLALATQKARAETAAKTATLTEMLRDQAREFDADKRSRKEELRDALSRNRALARELTDRDATVELLTEALGAATRDRVAAQWRLSAKAATARAEAAAARRKMRRIAAAADAKAARGNQTARAAATTEAEPEPRPRSALEHETNPSRGRPSEPAVRASTIDALREEIREELRASLKTEVIEALRESLRPTVEAELRAEARARDAREREALGGYARMAKIGLGVDAKRWRGAGTARDETTAPQTFAVPADATWSFGGASLPSDAAAPRGVASSAIPATAAAAATRGRVTRGTAPHARHPSRTERPVTDGPSTLALLATRTVEAAAHARSRLNPLRGANVSELVALHEAAAAKLAQQAEALVHEAEHALLEPLARISGSSDGNVVIEGAVIAVGPGAERSATETAATAVGVGVPPAALAPTTGARVVVPEETQDAASSRGGSEAKPATRRAKAREPSVWDAWYR